MMIAIFICTSTKLSGAHIPKSKSILIASHARKTCPYAHNVQDYRRNPV